MHREGIRGFTMNGLKSRDAVIKFLDYLEKKGMMAPATARARKAAINLVLANLDDRQAEDVTVVNLDDLMNIFEQKQGSAVNSASLRAYRGRVKSALADFANYLENPLAFKPNIKARERIASANPSAVGTAAYLPEGRIPDISRSSPAVGGPMASSILPIPIRENLTIHIQGVPFDLTEAEAKKIAAVIQALAV